MSTHPDNVLILIAHGSSDPQWRRPFEAHESGLKARLGADKVYLVYMENGHPTLEEVLELLVRREGRRPHVVLQPVFMAIGEHLRKDIPEQAAAAGEKYGVPIAVMPPVGEAPEVMQAISDTARNNFLKHTGHPVTS